MTSFKKYAPFLAIVVASISVWALGLHHYLSFDVLKSSQQVLQSFVEQHFVLALFGYAIAYIAIVALSIPGATFMTLLGGFLFGQFFGTVSVVMSATLGATLLYLATRSATETYINQKAGPWIQKMKAGFQENAFSYLLTLRLIPLFPFVAINLGAAILQVSLRTFFWGTLIGIIPGSFVYVSLGTGLRDVIQTSELSPQLILKPPIIAGLVGLGLLSLLPVLYKKFRQNRP